MNWVLLEMNSQTYSAKVEMELRQEGRVMALSHACEYYVILAEPHPVKTGEAEIRIRVDGREATSAIVIVSSVEPCGKKVKFW